MADLAPFGAAQEAFLTDAVRREVVVQHEVVFGGAFKRLDELGVPHGTQGRHDDGLGFAALEQGRAVRLREHADLDADGAHGLGIATVDARFAVEHVRANNVLLELVERLDDVIALESAVRAAYLGHHGVQCRSHRPLAFLLVCQAIRIRQRLTSHALHFFSQAGVDLRRLEVPGRFAGFGGKFLDRLDGTLHLHVGVEHATEHLVFRQFLGF